MDGQELHKVRLAVGKTPREMEALREQIAEKENELEQALTGGDYGNGKACGKGKTGVEEKKTKLEMKAKRELQRRQYLVSEDEIAEVAG